MGWGAACWGKRIRGVVDSGCDGDGTARNRTSMRFGCDSTGDATAAIGGTPMIGEVVGVGLCGDRQGLVAAACATTLLWELFTPILSLAPGATNDAGSTVCIWGAAASCTGW
jgi:hypothetical protein